MKNSIYVCLLGLCLHASPAQAASIFNDAIGDVAGIHPASGVFDLAEIIVGHEIDGQIGFSIRVTGNLADEDQVRFFVALSIGAGGDTSPTGNASGRPISMREGITHWIEGRIDGGTSARLWVFGASGWTLHSNTAAANPGNLNVLAGGDTMILAIDLAALGLGPGTSFKFDVFTAAGDEDAEESGAIDALSSPVPTGPELANPYQTPASASLLYTIPESRSTIHQDARHAWMPNAGWVSFANPGPPEREGVRVGEFFLWGHAWAPNFGWIHFGNGAPANHIAYSNTSATDYGVNRSPEGRLYGRAWAPNIGWIHFEDYAETDPVTFAGFDPPALSLTTGRFSGFAWAPNVGWMNLGAASLTAARISYPDADADGISDHWERAWFGNLTTAGRHTDSDGNGVSDHLEYISGSDPTDPDSWFRIVDHETDDDQRETEVELTTFPGRVFAIQSGTDLESWHLHAVPGWFPGFPDGANAITTVAHAPGPRRFFRGVASLPQPSGFTLPYSPDNYGWNESQSIDPTDFSSGWFSSHAYNPATGHPVIVRHNSNGGILRVSTFDGNAWQHTNIDTDWAGSHCSIAFGPDGHPAIAYRHYKQSAPNAAALRFARFNGTSWNIVEIESISPGFSETQHLGQSTSLAFNPVTGHPAISYQGVNQHTRFAWFDGASWHLETIDTNSSAWEQTSLAFSPTDGLPHVAYFRFSGGQTGLRLARRLGIGVWQTNQINPTNGSDGRYPSLAIHNDGRIAISHRNTLAGTSLIVSTSAGYNTLDATWTHTIVDSEGDTGYFTSIAFAPTGQPAVSYVHWNTRLKFAYFNGADWTIQTLHNGAVQNNTLRFRPDGTPSIAFRSTSPTSATRYMTGNIE